MSFMEARSKHNLRLRPIDVRIRILPRQIIQRQHARLKPSRVEHPHENLSVEDEGIGALSGVVVQIGLDGDDPFARWHVVERTKAFDHPRLRVNDSVGVHHGVLELRDVGDMGGARKVTRINGWFRVATYP